MTSIAKCKVVRLKLHKRWNDGVRNDRVLLNFLLILFSLNAVNYGQVNVLVSDSLEGSNNLLPRRLLPNCGGTD